MATTGEAKGQCLCGAVQFTAKQASDSVGACHCGMCRKWSGGPWLAVDCGTEVAFAGEEHIGLFNSSDWAERGFCKQCGTGLFYRVKEIGQIIMSAGLFDNQGALSMDHQVFIDEKPEYYTFANKTKDMTGAEVFAMYAPKPEGS